MFLKGVNSYNISLNYNMNMNPELENNSLNDFYVDVIFKWCFAGVTSIPFFASVVTQLGDLFRYKTHHEDDHRHCYEHG